MNGRGKRWIAKEYPFGRRSPAFHAHSISLSHDAISLKDGQVRPDTVGREAEFPGELVDRATPVAQQRDDTPSRAPENSHIFGLSIVD